MRILCLCFYFQPDLSAGSFKNSALVRELSVQVPPGSQLTVITTFPNRYASFDMEAALEEKIGNIRILRVRLPLHRSGMLDQSRAFLAYARSVVRIVKDQRFDLVYASSSRLMMSVLGAWISRRQNIPFYLDIRDLFVDTIKEILPARVLWFVMPVFTLLERWAVAQASHINVVSGGFVSYFTSRFPSKKLSVFTNGIDQEFIDVAPQDTVVNKKELPEVFYAGNMGQGQGLHQIIPELAKRFEGKLVFRLVGAGGRQAALQKALEDAGVRNVTMQGPVSREALLALYDKADILFLHLNDFEAFKKVLPSKIFEYAALGKPIWAGVGGYAADFIKLHIDNAAVFPPCDVDAAVNSFSSLEFKVQPRREFVAKFSRQAIINRMAAEIIGYANKTPVNDLEQ